VVVYKAGRFRPLSGRGALLIAENLCLRQQLLVVRRRNRSCACTIGPAVLDLRQSIVRQLSNSLLVMKPEAILT
jgi:hypothetical protein